MTITQVDCVSTDSLHNTQLSSYMLHMPDQIYFLDFVLLICGENSKLPSPIYFVPNTQMCDGPTYPLCTLESMQKVYEEAQKIVSSPDQQSTSKFWTSSCEGIENPFDHNLPLSSMPCRIHYGALGILIHTSHCHLTICTITTLAYLEVTCERQQKNG